MSTWKDSGCRCDPIHSAGEVSVATSRPATRDGRQRCSSNQARCSASDIEEPAAQQGSNSVVVLHVQRWQILIAHTRSFPQPGPICPTPSLSPLATAPQTDSANRRFPDGSSYQALTARSSPESELRLDRIAPGVQIEPRSAVLCDRPGGLPDWRGGRLRGHSSSDLERTRRSHLDPLRGRSRAYPNRQASPWLENEDLLDRRWVDLQRVHPWPRDPCRCGCCVGILRQTVPPRPIRPAIDYGRRRGLCLLSQQESRRTPIAERASVRAAD